MGWGGIRMDTFMNKNCFTQRGLEKQMPLVLTFCFIFIHITDFLPISIFLICIMGIINDLGL
jgi:hypothetical protein